MAIESKMNKGPIGRPMKKEGKGGKSGRVWVILLILLVAVIGGWYALSGNSTTSTDGDSDQVEYVPSDSGEYQAVFLDNGQVYFGKLEEGRGQFYTLTEVFYLQSGTTIDQTSNLALTKLGNEAHGPEDRMELNVDHILFIEDMKAESKVVQAIFEYKNSNY
jgi:hypothetical protein